MYKLLVWNEKKEVVFTTESMDYKKMFSLYDKYFYSDNWKYLTLISYDIFSSYLNSFNIEKSAKFLNYGGRVYA